MVVLYYVSLALCNQIRNSVNLWRKTKRGFLSFDHHEKGQNNRVTQISSSYDLPFLNGDTDLLSNRVATSAISVSSEYKIISFCERRSKYSFDLMPIAFFLFRNRVHDDGIVHLMKLVL